ncbi:MAG: hypothetical protein J3Q66DRAFT_361239 [Benniella sp.]|nr:MAG: hypothetical protein J3Q66DRAFT_361239 [Benniella sp.]
MGVEGHQGTFKVSGETTLRVLRANAQQLGYIMESLIHDPLAEWAKAKDKDSVAVQA